MAIAELAANLSRAAELGAAGDGGRSRSSARSGVHRPRQLYQARLWSRSREPEPREYLKAFAFGHWRCLTLTRR